MLAKKKKPILAEDKEGNVKFQVFKNKNIKGTVYSSTRIWVYRFPFKYNRTLDLSYPEVQRLKKLLERYPIIK